MKVKSPSSGGKDFSAMGVPEAFVGKGPGRSGQPAGEGCEETARYFLPSLHPQPWNSSLEVQGAGIMGQRSSEKSVGWRWGWPLVLRLWHSSFLLRSRVASEVVLVI